MSGQKTPETVVVSGVATFRGGSSKGNLFKNRPWGGTEPNSMIKMDKVTIICYNIVQLTLVDVVRLWTHTQRRMYKIEKEIVK